MTQAVRLRLSIIVLSAFMLAGALGSFLLFAMGRLGLDLGWGRSLHPLGPITVRIAAPRKMVFEMLSSPYLSRAPAGSGIDVLARDEKLVVAAHYTKVHFYTARTVETVEFEPDERVSFRHLMGPVPHAVEAFELSESSGETTLEYTGEIGIDFYALGRLAGKHWVRPQWEDVVGEHLEDVKARAEERARRTSRPADS